MALPKSDGKILTSEDMDHALALLDAEIAKSELLMSVAPIRLISVGGSLAVKICQNREMTWDIDCLLDPNVAAAVEFREELDFAVRSVAEKGGYTEDWLNLQVEIFVGRERRMDLFLGSLNQNITVFEGANLTILAGRLDWALERKIRRVAHARQRRYQKDIDIPDAAALIKLIKGDDAPPISFDYIKGLNFNGFDVPPTDEAIKNVAGYYAKAYGEVGIAEMVWDKTEQRTKYRDVDGNWVWTD